MIATMGDIQRDNSVASFRKFGAKNKYRKASATASVQPRGFFGKLQERLKGSPMELPIRGVKGKHKGKLFLAPGHVRRSHYVVGRQGWYGSGGAKEVRGREKSQVLRALNASGGQWKG